jgi:hypothetical protein
VIAKENIPNYFVGATMAKRCGGKPACPNRRSRLHPDDVQSDHQRISIMNLHSPARSFGCFGMPTATPILRLHMSDRRRGLNLYRSFSRAGSYEKTMGRARRFYDRIVAPVGR